MGKSIFQKLGLVETEEERLSPEELEAILSERRDATKETLEVPEDMNVEGLIEVNEVYTKYEIDDLSKSIFRVNEFSNIPGIASLPTDIKRQSVTGILAASGLSVEGLVEDGAFRINALGATLTAFNDETNNIVSANENLIIEYQAKIDECKKTINDRKVLQEQQEKLFNETSLEIDKIVKFIKPVIQ